MQSSPAVFPTQFDRQRWLVAFEAVDRRNEFVLHSSTLTKRMKEGNGICT
jgi:hypothetical protein